MDEQETIYTPLSWDRTAYEWRAMIRSPYCDLTPTQKLLLNVMCSYGKRRGEDIFPSQRQLADHSGISLTYVNETMKQAEKEGWIERIMMPIGEGQKRTVYQLAIPLGVSDATTFLKARFWLPPFKYKMERIRNKDAPHLDTVRLLRKDD